MAVSRTHQARRITRLRQDSVETTYSLYLGCVCEWVDTGSGSAPSPAPLAAAEPAARAWMGAALAVLLSCAAEVMSRSLSTAAASVSPRLIWSCRACCAESEKKVKRRFRRFRSHRQSEIHLTDTVPKSHFQFKVQMLSFKKFVASSHFDRLDNQNI